MAQDVGILLTPSILVAEIREAPHVGEVDGEPDDGEQEVHLFAPGLAFAVTRRRSLQRHTPAYCRLPPPATSCHLLLPSTASSVGNASPCDKFISVTQIISTMPLAQSKACLIFMNSLSVSLLKLTVLPLTRYLTFHNQSMLLYKF